MKILMLTCNASLQDGINRHILTVATALNKKPDVSVAVCTTYPTGELNVALLKEGVKTYSLECAHGHSILIFCRFWRVMRDFKPDIVHGHVISLFSGVILRLFFRHIPLVLTIHGISDPVKKSVLTRVFHFGIRKLSPDAKYRIYVSGGVQNAVGGGEDKKYIIYNPIQKDTSFKLEKNTLHALLGLDTSIPLVGTACRVADVKQPIVFTQVMIEILKQHNLCHSVIIGDDCGTGILDQLKEMILDANLSDRFHLLGYRSDARTLVRDLSCFILTSLREGMPTALLEAMVAGTPIAFMEGEGGLIDLAEMNKSEDGSFAIVVPKGEVDLMAERVLHLLVNKNQAQILTANAKCVVEKYFSTTTVVNQLIAVYRSLLILRSF